MGSAPDDRLAPLLSVNTSQRGVDRNDIREGLRIIAFEKVAVLAMLVTDDAATVVRVFYHGQDWEGPLRRQYGGSGRDGGHADGPRRGVRNPSHRIRRRMELLRTMPDEPR